MEDGDGEETIDDVSGGQGDWRHRTIDDISRRHQLSYEIKAAEIDPVVEAGGLSHGFSSKRMCSGEVFFSVSLESGRWEATIDDISRRHKLPYEKKFLTSVQCLELEDWSSDFANNFKYLDMHL
ncbi:hypothetical protein AVEN_7802-1 [Araneus ventricosus]|uniref:Uncharacterized protein n=1 Tax=Araneus ventricosus TaxID=182803 RepID=A0A4Y2T2G9_ARAVE|nr:hypothetical protein AVEN_7802-1 [Araneus ventricosus]